MGMAGRITRSDVITALSVAALVIAHAAFEPADRPAATLDFALLAVASLALVIVRWAPVVALGISAACVLIYLIRVGQDVISVVPVLIGVYYAVRTGHHVVAPLAAVPFIVAGFVDATSPSDGILPIGWFAAALCFGELHRQWRAYLSEARLRADEAERTQEEVALRRAGDERLRIARDLHDSLTHTMSVIKVQADAAVHLARKRGDDVPEVLLAIQNASRDGNRELRSTLSALRSPERDDMGNGLEQLPALIERTRDAGVEVTMTSDGDQRPLPAAVEGTVYRVVQEALTNVSRHSGTDTARVRLTFTTDVLDVTIDDDGTAAPAHAVVPGVGLIGMRERIAAHGGTLEAGPKPDGGFRVKVHLPTGERSS